MLHRKRVGRGLVVSTLLIVGMVVSIIVNASILKTSTESVAQPNLNNNIDFVSQIGGVAEAVAIDGSIAYLGEGARLTILDISNLASPSLIVRTDLLPKVIKDLIKMGDYVYIAAGSAGLYVFDVSNPNMPTIVSALTTSDATGLHARGDLLYLAESQDGVRIIDVSAPTNPQEIGHWDTNGDVRKVVATDTHAYIADGEEGLRVLDISDPINPSEAGFYDTPGWALDVTVAGSYAYVADNESLQIIDISNPLAPLFTGSYTNSSSIWSITYMGSYVYISDYFNDGGMQILDVSDPTTPVDLGYYPVWMGVSDLAVVTDDLDPFADTVYTVGPGYGLHIIDVNNATAPELIGDFRTSGWVQDVAIRDRYAFVVNVTSLWVLDLINPSAPVTVDILPLSRANSISLDGNFAYVADTDNGFRVFDIGDPFDPLSVSEIAVHDTSFAEDIVVKNGFAYVADGNAGLRIVDVSNPSSPFGISSFNTGDYAWGVDVAGDYAFVADRMDGLRIIDISDPYVPDEVGFIDTEGWAIDVDADAEDSNFGFNIYVATNDGGMRVVFFDPSPVTILEVGVFDSEDIFAQQITIEDKRAYVSGSDFRIVDIHDPTQPTEIGFFETSNSPKGMASLDNNTHVVADQFGGIVIVDFNTISNLFTPGVNGSMTYTDTQGLSTMITIPGGAITDTTILAYTPIADPNLPLNFTFANHAFDLTAYQYGIEQANFGFSEPISVTIHYSDDDIGELDELDEAELTLLVWNGTNWVDATTTCIPVSTYDHNLNDNVISLSICHVSRFALAINRDINNVFLPILQKGD